MWYEPYGYDGRLNLCEVMAKRCGAVNAECLFDRDFPDGAIKISALPQIGDREGQRGERVKVKEIAYSPRYTAFLFTMRSGAAYWIDARQLGYKAASRYPRPDAANFLRVMESEDRTEKGEVANATPGNQSDITKSRRC